MRGGIHDLQLIATPYQIPFELDISGPRSIDMEFKSEQIYNRLRSLGCSPVHGYGRESPGGIRTPLAPIF